MSMTKNALDLIKSRCEKATQGPWVSWVEGRDHFCGSSFIMTGEKTRRGCDIELVGATVGDQDFIAHARQDVPALIKEIERLWQVIEKMELAELASMPGNVTGGVQEQ